MRERILAVEHLGARRLELLLRLPAPFDTDHGVVRAVPDCDRRQGAFEVEREPLDGRDEPAQREDAGRARAVRPEPERGSSPRPARSHRSPPRRNTEAVQPGRGALVARQEGLRVREAELADDVPVLAAGRQLERPAGVAPRSRRSGSSASSSGCRSFSSVPRPWKRTSAPSGSPAAGGPRFEQLGQLLAAQASRGFGSGVRAGSTWSRSCS